MLRINHISSNSVLFRCILVISDSIEFCMILFDSCSSDSVELCLILFHSATDQVCAISLFSVVLCFVILLDSVAFVDGFSPFR